MNDYTTISRDLMRRPLQNIESKYNTPQVKPQLSVAVESYDLLPYEVMTSEDTAGDSNFSRVKSCSTCRRRPLTAASSTSTNKPCRSAKGSKVTEDSEDGESVLYAIRAQSGASDPSVTRYTWDRDTMQYTRCRSVPRRALSAPVTLSDPSAHLQKLFRAIWDCESPCQQSRGKRSQTAKARYSDETLDHISRMSSHTESEDTSVDKDVLESVEGGSLVPLSFEQAAHTNKVIPVTDSKIPEMPESMSETTPVIFNKDYLPRPYTPAHSSRSSQGFTVRQEHAETIGLCGRKTPITRLEMFHSVSEPERLQSSPDVERKSFEEVEVSHDEAVRAGEEDKEKASSSGGTTSCQSPAGEASTDLNEHSQVNKPNVQKRKSQHRLPSKPPSAKPKAKAKTPRLPAEVRAHIVRQCTMPSYAVLHQPDTDSAGAADQSAAVKAVAVERFTDTKERGKNLIKPVYQPFTKRSLVKSVPTIMPNGPTGSKTFLSITMPKDTLLHVKTNIVRRERDTHPRKRRGRPAPQSCSDALQNTQIESSTLSGGHAPFLAVSRGNSLTLPPKRTSLVSRKSSRGSVQNMTLSKHSTLPASHVDVSIPTAIPASTVVSSNSFSYSGDSLNQSWTLDDTHSEVSDEVRSPLPCTQSAEKEDTKAMKERVHRELLKTLSATEQFLQAMKYKRQHKPPQLVYSDDEELLPKESAHSYVEDFVNADMARAPEAAARSRHDSGSMSDSCNNSVAADVDLRDQLRERALSLSTDISA